MATETTSAGPCIETRSGGLFDFGVADGELNVTDIAHALGNLCRFQGHCLHFYSVAEHSYLMATYALDVLESVELARACLWHDAPEAYIGDIPSPLKDLLRIYGVPIAEYEARIWRRLAAEFDLPPTLPEVVHELDLRILVDERQALTSLRGQRDNVWPCLDGVQPLGVNVKALDPVAASSRWRGMRRKLEGLR